jgi:hypothetical protein
MIDNRRNYSQLEVMAHSNCLLAFCILLGLFAFAIALAIGMATGWIMTGLALYVFILCSFILFICACIVIWQVRGLWIDHEKKVKQNKLLDQQIAMQTRALKMATKADAQNDNVKWRINDKESVLEVIRAGNGKQQTATRVVESRVPSLPGQGQIPQRSLAIDPRVVAQRKLIASIQVPTFGEAMASGLIVPGQEEILICFELEIDEYTGELTGRLRQYQDSLSNNCTMFLGGGSKSGKSTLMAWLGAQEALMGALFYIIDPHLAHPEKSIAKKLEGLQHAFILPPAASERDIKLVLDHAEYEAYARTQDPPIETPYSGRPIVFVVDEALVLFGRAQRNPEDKELQKFYRRLALFMRDLGTAYNKFDMNGIFATQYLTKDAFKLPGGFNIDFRDACQNQTLLRLPPNQAQVMRLLQREELREMRTLRQGFGFMGFATGDIIRMASGNITKQDIENIAPMVPPAPKLSKQFTGWVAPQVSEFVESDTPVGVSRPQAQEQQTQTRITGPLKEELPEVMPKVAKRATLPDAIEVWNKTPGIGRPQLRKELQARGFECSDYLSAQLLEAIHQQIDVTNNNNNNSLEGENS